MLILISRLLLMTAVWRVAEGKETLPYSSNEKCDNPTTEYYHKTKKICCSKCKPGTRLEVECTAHSDTICAPCEYGQYLDRFNYNFNCFSCRHCKEEKGLVYHKNCTADSQTVCVCKPGLTCVNTVSECDLCKKYQSCKPGEYISRKGSPKADVKCEACPSGSFSNHSNAQFCQPHTRCYGGSVLSPGTSKTDAQCGKTPLTSTTTTTQVSVQTSSKHAPLNFPRENVGRVNTTTTPSLLPSSSVTPTTPENRTTIGPNSDTSILIYSAVIACGVVFLLTLAVMGITCMLRKRKGVHKDPITGGKKVEQDLSKSDIPDCQHLLTADRCQKEPSMSSSDSQSQPDSSQSHVSGDWLERTSQEGSLPELPSVSSPLVNLSITATFNCHLNPATASCSIPMNTSALTPRAEAPVPLSQEEVCVSCQQEDGKEALQSVQESGPCTF
ncbi:tumor necrosis factor receptor superfamily member 1B [Pimephales promelas]|uniref:tumor necrosis factor receptor superfamily member 1B n=1 Tax=Pimephales promelas TaxID=90988 RepID=UPI001955D781|nr:tumor necrosis factor receptor superfamily member 1B [Pimephales promelas]KAG1950244.1 tumor necrosis factor receptor superfamily member 1B [Pimephales promelas]